MNSQNGIHTVDTEFYRSSFDASYLVVENGRAAFIDCGTQHSVPLLLAALTEHGLTPESVDWLILTHVHLDHAGGAGALMQHLPNARVVVHPRGAPHMVDPTRLIQSATRVFGAETVARNYGRILPVQPSRVVTAEDGHVVDLAGRPLVCIDTPGHARHHICMWDEKSRSWFTGDTFGLSYREFDSPNGPFILPTTSPPEFDPEGMKSSIRRMLAKKPEAVYIAHYNRLENVERLGNDLIQMVDAMVRLALELDTGKLGRHERLVEGLTQLYVRRVRTLGSELSNAQIRDALSMNIELNAQGLGVWLDRTASRSATALACNAA